MFTFPRASGPSPSEVVFDPAGTHPNHRTETEVGQEPWGLSTPRSIKHPWPDRTLPVPWSKPGARWTKPATRCAWMGTPKKRGVLGAKKQLKKRITMGVVTSAQGSTYLLKRYLGPPGAYINSLQSFSEGGYLDP